MLMTLKTEIVRNRPPHFCAHPVNAWDFVNLCLAISYVSVDLIAHARWQLALNLCDDRQGHHQLLFGAIPLRMASLFVNSLR
mmetsp:Transcript_4822/g.9415  ORF Transcript_4822/g.9415 Transcript_4822/m.9415 type:complete len:82 (+) Transcript_4822:105-350(+)